MTKPAAPLRRFALAAAAPLILLAAATPAYVQAAAADPAATKIEGFTDTLIEAMKSAKSLGAEGRYRKLNPAVTQAFDLAAMTRFAVGPKFATSSPDDQAAMIKAFSRMSVATWASEFDSYSGQSFKIDPDVTTRGLDKLVKTQIVTPKKPPISLTFRMRESGGSWKAIDVYYMGSISQLTTLRSDISAAMDKGGADAVVKKLNTTSDGLLKG